MELKGDNISFKYPFMKEFVLNWGITLNNNKSTGLVGDSGGGKSILCKILADYLTDFGGNVTLNSINLLKNDFCPVQLIYQHLKNVINQIWKMNKILWESWDVYNKLLDDFGIQKFWLNRFPQELSGGELYES